MTARLPALVSAVGLGLLLTLAACTPAPPATDGAAPPSDDGSTTGATTASCDGDGVPTSYTGGSWNDLGDGRYGIDLLVFDSDLDGQPGLMEVTAMPEGATFDGERYDGDVVVLGIYCITYAVEE